ncbi:MAG: YXWGXW repeat-containing protein [Agriterribacter sp.]
MKSIYSLLSVIIIAIVFSSCARRVYVSERPLPPPMAVRPGVPYPGAVWIPEEYAWRGGRYEYIAPHYVQPRRGHTWVAGYWNGSGRRSVWVKGHWRR